MAQIYCPHCFALMSDRAKHCPSCRRWNPVNPLGMAFGGILLAAILAGIVTGIYGRLIYLFWPRWRKLFDVNDLNGDVNAEEAAFLIGVAIFLFTITVGILSMRRNKAK